MAPKISCLTRIAAFLWSAAILTACSTIPESDETVETESRTNALEFVEHPSPNFNERTRAVDILMFHYTAGSTESSLKQLCSPTGSTRVSSHYVIDPEGVIYRLVDESKRAWHAGTGTWRGVDDVNSGSIGIEIVNPGWSATGERVPYPEKQLAALLALSKDILSRHAIRSVLGHSDTGLGRKDDPGEHFPWARFAAEGIGIWTDDFVDPKLSDRAMLETIGYDVHDVQLARKAFERHFYPEAITSSGKRTRERLAAVYNLVISTPQKK